MRPPRVTGTRIVYGICALLVAVVVGDLYFESRSGGPVRTVKPEEARVVVERYGAETLELAGAVRTDTDAETPEWSPCDGQPDDVYSMLLIWQIKVPPGTALQTLERVRERWRALGYRITKERTFDDDPSGDLSAVNPRDHHSLSLVATTEEPYFVLMISSPCYRSPTPLE